MGNNLEFILKLTDHFSTAMQAAKNVSDHACTRIASDINRANQSGRTMALSVNELRQRLEAVNQVRFGTRITNEFKSATRQARELERQIERLESKGQKSGGGSMVGDFVKGNLIAGGIQKVLSIGSELISGSYQKTLQNKGLSNAINTTTGGQGKEAMAQTKSIADRYGINYEASLEGVKTLTGGLMSMNMPLKEQMKIFEGVSTGVAAMGLTAEQSKGAMLALGQMASKGTVSAEELRGQLGERIPGAFGLAAKAMNVTEAQLNSMLQKGEIAAKDFLPKLATEMQKTFGADALKNANGPQAVAERFNNAIYDMKVTIGQGLMPIITPMLEVFTNLATAALPTISWILNQVATFLSGINTEGGVWAVWIDLVKQYGLIVWNGLMRISSTVWSIIKSVVQWAASSQIIQDIFWVIGTVAEGIFWAVGKIGDAIKWIWDNIIKPIFTAIDWVYSKVKSLTNKPIEIVNTNTGYNLPNVIKAPPGLTNPLTLNRDNNKSNETNKGREAETSITKSKADSINSGGQRSIVINIGKMVEKIEMNVADGKQGAEDTAQRIREEVLRMFYSLNGNVG